MCILFHFYRLIVPDFCLIQYFQSFSVINLLFPFYHCFLVIFIIPFILLVYGVIIMLFFTSYVEFF